MPGNRQYDGTAGLISHLSLYGRANIDNTTFSILPIPSTGYGRIIASQTQGFKLVQMYTNGMGEIATRMGMYQRHCILQHHQQYNEKLTKECNHLVS